MATIRDGSTTYYSASPNSPLGEAPRQIQTRKPWIIAPKPSPAARIRLFCFPYAGAGASIFRSWASGVPSSVEICPIQLPGRENRLREAPYQDAFQMLDALGRDLAPYLSLPFAIFGHSMGALLAFELARQLVRRQMPAPIHLFVSGQRAPQMRSSDPAIFHLSDREFLEAVRCRYDAIPPEVFSNPELMRMLLPTLRADFAVTDTYVYRPDAVLPCPITCLGGIDDPDTSQEQLAAWRVQTAGKFALRMFPGDHFFLRSAQTSLLQAVSSDLLRFLQQKPEMGGDAIEAPPTPLLERPRTR